MQLRRSDGPSDGARLRESIMNDFCDKGPRLSASLEERDNRAKLKIAA